MSISLQSVMFLLLAFQFKHFLADFPLQNQFMLGKFKNEGWVKPLLAHVGVHGIFTFIIAFTWLMFYQDNVLHSAFYALGITLYDVVLHFTIDRMKVMYGKLTNTTPADKRFWNAIGLDQLAHHITHYAIVALLIMFVLK